MTVSEKDREENMDFAGNKLNYRIHFCPLLEKISLLMLSLNSQNAKALLWILDFFLLPNAFLGVVLDVNH